MERLVSGVNEEQQGGAVCPIVCLVSQACLMRADGPSTSMCGFSVKVVLRVGQEDLTHSASSSADVQHLCCSPLSLGVDCVLDPIRGLCL